MFFSFSSYSNWFKLLVRLVVIIGFEFFTWTYKLISTTLWSTLCPQKLEDFSALVQSLSMYIPYLSSKFIISPVWGSSM